MKSEKSELKPCPFCGTDDEAIGVSEGTQREVAATESTPFYYVECAVCGSAGHGNADKSEAIAAWNRRAAPEPEQGDRERAEALAERIYALRGENFILGAHKGGDCYRETCDCIARDFAALLAQVRAEERERCARVCEEVENEKKGIGSKVAWDFGHGAGIAAAAIRKGEP